ncbi:MAG TPA: type III glutamate--ammonia ligase [Oceanospirillaceae bacterium]|nr:type III glutamate--ammonia ligase [Oceanospirillaceae bacterium]
MATDINLTDYAAEHGIKYFLFNFTDLFGIQRAKLVPAAAAAGMQKSGAGFAGFAAWLDLTPAHPDMIVMPDTSSLIQLPWKPEVAWVAGDPWMDGKPVDQGPRNVLKKLMAETADMGMIMKSGVEPEFHLISADGTEISDERDIQEKPCYDQSAVMRRYDVIAEICDYMAELGWGPYQNDHEDANGQFEMNWDFTDALTMADQMAFFKFMVKEVAELHGLRATFMPKPFTELTGNGCHVHISMWDKSGTNNLFQDPEGELGLSKLAYNFIGGLLEHGEALAAITNPTVNSYKRINAAPTLSGATWAPNSITYGGNNRTHMIRIPDDNRFEFRLADNSANPYLLMAVALASGLHGMKGKIDPGKRLDIDMYATPELAGETKKLPLNLLDAIRNFDADESLKSALGDEFSAAYTKLKLQDWNSYSRHLTQWERDNTLDC